MKKKLITTSLIAALFAVPAMATQDEIDQKTVTSKYYVDTTKQDKITTDKVLAVDNDGNDDVYVPAIVTTNAAGTELSGDSIGVLSLETFDTVGLNLDDFYEREDLVPTVAALAPAFNGVYDEIDTIVGDIQGDITTINTTIETKQDKIVAGTSGNVVTYTGTAGQVGSANVASDALYSNNTLYNGSDVANIAAVETKQDKMTCAGYLAGHENDEDYCWLYSVAETRQTCTPNSQSCDPSNNTCCSGFCNPDKLGNYHCRATPF